MCYSNIYTLQDGTEIEVEESCQIQECPKLQGATEDEPFAMTPLNTRAASPEPMAMEE